MLSSKYLKSLVFCPLCTTQYTSCFDCFIYPEGAFKANIQYKNPPRHHFWPLLYFECLFYVLDIVVMNCIFCPITNFPKFFSLSFRMLEYSLDGHNVSFSAIRTVRVLRPLRAINRVPSEYCLLSLCLSFSCHCQRRRYTAQLLIRRKWFGLEKHTPVVFIDPHTLPWCINATSDTDCSSLASIDVLSYIS